MPEDRPKEDDIDLDGTEDDDEYLKEFSPEDDEDEIVEEGDTNTDFEEI